MELSSGAIIDGVKLVGDPVVMGAELVDGQ